MIQDGKQDFDSMAASWDQEPRRVKLASDIVGAIIDEVDITPDMDALDFGCGTGLVTLPLQPLVQSMTAIDGSQRMMDVLREKIRVKNLTNVSTRILAIEKGDVLEGCHHLIVSSMTLHHIKDTKALLDQFYKVALPSGYLCIADLDLDGGLFHSDNTGVMHFGFDRDQLKRLFIEAGFENVRHRTAAKMTKAVHGDKLVEFTVFLMIGRKAV